LEDQTGVKGIKNKKKTYTNYKSLKSLLPAQSSKRLWLNSIFDPVIGSAFLLKNATKENRIKIPHSSVVDHPLRPPKDQRLGKLLDLPTT
jgi:hypothetical protein